MKEERKQRVPPASQGNRGMKRGDMVKSPGSRSKQGLGLPGTPARVKLRHQGSGARTRPRFSGHLIPA